MKTLCSRAFVLTSALSMSLPGTGAGQVPPAPPDVAAIPADALKTASGLASKVLETGKGERRPTKGDLVVVHYTGWTTDGKMFDSSATRGKPSTFAVERLLPGLSEGLQLLVVGETRRLWIPESLAYKGAAGRPKGMLVFDVQLLDIEASPTAPPPDVAKPPADARRTASGLAYKVIKDGTGSTNPSRSSRVTVHYTGWTTDGKMFDSSVSRGQPTTFGLNQVIQGWTEGIQLMVEGDKRRFWIPENLAYQGQPGMPKGMLVFDIELLKIER
jgi:peptidylprolyl isomerase